MQQWLNAMQRTGKWLEDAVLVLLLVALILLAATQIFLRNFFDTGFSWSDELLRLLVLWLALAGAVAASRQDRHISIAVLDRWVPAGLKRFTRFVLDVFTASVSALIAWHSTAFVRTTHQYGDTMLGDFPAWILQMVLPVGFALIAWRYAVFALKGMTGQRVERTTP